MLQAQAREKLPEGDSIAGMKLTPQMIRRATDFTRQMMKLQRLPKTDAGEMGEALQRLGARAVRRMLLVVELAFDFNQAIGQKKRRFFPPIKRVAAQFFADVPEGGKQPAEAGKMLGKVNGEHAIFVGGENDTGHLGLSGQPERLIRSRGPHVGLVVPGLRLNQRSIAGSKLKSFPMTHKAHRPARAKN